MPGEISLQCAVGLPIVPVCDAPRLIYLLIEVTHAVAVADEQTPVNVNLVLDHSGSMSGEKLRYMKEAVKLMLDQLEPQDYVSVVIFDDAAQVVLPSQLVSNRVQLSALVDRIQDRGGTEISRGMELRLVEAEKVLAPDRVSCILLVTDGYSYGDEDRCRYLAGVAGGNGLPIIALGLGDDWNEELLDAIAQASGGYSDYVDKPVKLQQIFQGVLQRMKRTAARNASLGLRLVGGIALHQVWRVIPLIEPLSSRFLSDRDIEVPLGSLEKGTGQAVLVELLLSPRPVGCFRIAQAAVSYCLPDARVVGEKTHNDILIAVTDNPVLAQQYDPRVMNVVKKVAVFKLLARAMDQAKTGNVTGATQKLRAVATRLLELGDNDLAASAQRELRRLEQGQGLSAAGTKRLQYQTRKLTQKLDSNP